MDKVAKKSPRPSFESGYLNGAFGPELIKKYAPLVKKAQELIKKSKISAELKKSFSDQIKDAWSKSQSKYGFFIVGTMFKLYMNSSDESKLSSSLNDIYKKMGELAKTVGVEEYFNYIYSEIAKQSGWKQKKADRGNAFIEKKIGTETIVIKIENLTYISKGKCSLTIEGSTATSSDWQTYYDCKSIKNAVQSIKSIEKNIELSSKLRIAKRVKMDNKKLANELLKLAKEIVSADKIQTGAIRKPFYSLSDGVAEFGGAVKSDEVLKADKQIVKFVKMADSLVDDIHDYLQKNYKWD